MPTLKVYMSFETQENILEEINKEIDKNSKEYDVEKALIKAIIKQESNDYIFAYRIDFSVLKGQQWYERVLEPYEKTNKECYASYGLMQVLYGVAKSYGFKGSPFELFYPRQNIMYGCKLLQHLLKKYKNNIKDVISAYNYGIVKKDKKGKYVNQHYVDNVYKWYKKYGGKL